MCVHVVDAPMTDAIRVLGDGGPSVAEQWRGGTGGA
jgi:hypothetical protein